MSASREKHIRKSVERTLPEHSAKTSGLSKTAKMAIGIACAVVLVVLCCVSLVLGSNWPHTHFTAATVGDYELTAADFNYYYQQAYNDMANSLGDSAQGMMSFFTDSIRQNAMKYVQQTYAGYDAAIKANLTLTDEEKQELDETVETFESVSAMFGLKDGDEYMEFVYGKGCNLENYRKFCEITLLSQKYYEAELEKYAPTEAEINTYYQENRDELDRLNYRQFFITVNDERDLETAKAEAQRMITEIVTDITSFDRNALALAEESQKTQYERENATLLSAIKPSLLTEQTVAPEVAEWLKDLNRKEGDTATFVKPDESGVYAMYFISRDDNDYTSRTLRTIYVSLSATADEGEKETTKEQAQGYLDTYLAGERTEEAFAELADQHSEDGIVGGLQENMGKNDLTAVLSDWLYDANRKVGDTELLETSSGYYVALYCGEGENYKSFIIENSMDSTYYNDMVDRMSESFPAETVRMGQKFVTTMTLASQVSG